MCIRDRDCTMPVFCFCYTLYCLLGEIFYCKLIQGSYEWCLVNRSRPECQMPSHSLYSMHLIMLFEWMKLRQVFSTVALQFICIRISMHVRIHYMFADDSWSCVLPHDIHAENFIGLMLTTYSCNKLLLMFSSVWHCDYCLKRNSLRDRRLAGRGGLLGHYWNCALGDGRWT